MYVFDNRRIASQERGYCYGDRVMFLDKEQFAPQWLDLYDAGLKYWKFYWNLYQSRFDSRNRRAHLRFGHERRFCPDAGVPEQVAPPPMARRSIGTDTGLQQKISLGALVLSLGRWPAPLPRRFLRVG